MISGDLKVESKKDLDIQALRGIAVFLVFLNHTHYLVNGFLGVDIFFVISGFVIAKSVAKRYLKYDLNFLGSFLYRRFSRLLPALIVSIVLISSIFLILNLLSEKSFNTAFFSIFGLSNIYLAKTGIDYFGSQASLNPFVPTWSLSVEEQSYFFLALVLILGFESNFNIKKTKDKYSSFIISNFFLLACIILSIISYFIINKNLGFLSSYYLPFGRFWEIGIGWLTWKLISSSKKNNLINQNNYYLFNRYTCTILLIILVIIPVEKSFTLTFLTVIVTSFFLLSQKTNLQYLIKNEKIKYKSFKYKIINHLYNLGDRSYSFYLYHSAVIFIFPKNVYMVFIAYCFTYILSHISFIYIEKRLNTKLLNSKFNTRIFYVLSILFLPLLLMKIVVDTNILKNNIIYNYFTLPTDKWTFYNNLDQKYKCSNKEIKTKLNRQNNLKCIYLIGDSHALASTAMFWNIEKNYPYKIVGLSLDGLYTESMMKNDLKYNLKDISSERFDYLKDNLKDNDVVFIINQLTTWFGETFNDSFSDHRLYLPNTKNPLDRDKALNYYLKDIEKMAKLTYQRKATLIVYLTPPDFPVDPITCVSPFNRFTPFLDRFYFNKSCSYQSKIYHERISKIESGLDFLQSKYNSNLKILKSYDIPCDEETCSAIVSGKSLYADDDHPGKLFFKILQPKVEKLLGITTNKKTN